MSSVDIQVLRDKTHTWHAYPEYRPSRNAFAGSIPAHWKEKPAKRLIQNLVVKGVGRTLPFIALEYLEPSLGRPVSSFAWEDAQADEYAVFRPEDTLFGKLRPYLRKFLFCDMVGCCPTELLVLRPQDSSYLPAFLFYLVQSHPFVSAAEATSYGVKMPRTSWEKLGVEHLWLPTAKEQKAIVRFVVCETAKIDYLIGKKAQLITLLKEKRAASISEAVTKGLNSTSGHKESQAEWIGTTPEHWQVPQLRRAISKFVDYRGATPEKAPTGVRLITATNVRGGSIDLTESEEFIRERDYAAWMVRGLPEKGDVLLTTEAPLGEVAQVDDVNVALAQRIILLKTNRRLMNNSYLKYYFLSASGQGELNSRATGSTAIGIKASHLKETLVTVPLLEEQEEISRYLDQETSKIDGTIRSVNKAIARLKEYRTALTSAAVTGQIDVRSEVE